MKKAIREVLKDTTHLWCKCHIFNDVPEKNWHRTGFEKGWLPRSPLVRWTPPAPAILAPVPVPVPPPRLVCPQALAYEALSTAACVRRSCCRYHRVPSQRQGWSPCSRTPSARLPCHCIPRCHPLPRAQSPTFIWVTSSLHSPRFNSCFIMSLLSYHLTSPPDLLRACHVGRSVFHARISNQNVANFVVPRGFLELNRLRFHLHSSELQASAMANALKVDEGVIAPHPPAAVASCFVSTQELHMCLLSMPAPL